MSTVEKIGKERARLERELDRLSQERKKIEQEIRGKQGEIAELDSALRVISRLDSKGATSPKKPDGGKYLPLVVAPKDKRAAMHAALLHAPGSKMRHLIEIAKSRFGYEIAKKTAGNILWQFKNDGLARREGYKWFPVKKGNGQNEAPRQ